MDILRALALLSTYGLLLLSVVYWGYVAYRLGHYPENHVGWNVLWSLTPFGLLAVAALLHWRLSQSHFSVWIMIFALLSGLLALGIYHFDILLPYEIWLERGMPDRPF